jgi:hypothetical protein
VQRRRYAKRSEGAAAVGAAPEASDDARREASDAAVSAPRSAGSGANAEVREVRLAADARPQRDAAATRAVLEVVDDEARFKRSTDEQARRRSLDLDAHVRPRARLEVDVRLELAGCVLAQATPREVRIRFVLRRPIAEHLIVEPRVLRP